jgi:hypothetical protein
MKFLYYALAILLYLLARQHEIHEGIAVAPDRF